MSFISQRNGVADLHKRDFAQQPLPFHIPVVWASICAALAPTRIEEPHDAPVVEPVRWHSELDESPQIEEQVMDSTPDLGWSMVVPKMDRPAAAMENGHPNSEADDGLQASRDQRRSALTRAKLMAAGPRIADPKSA